MQASRGELKETRKDLLEAVRAEHFDPLLLEGMFGRHDERVSSVRAALTGALARVHEALDDAQRVRLAGLIRNGLGGAATPTVPLAPVATGDVLFA